MTELIPFIVKVRGQTYHVKAKDKESAAMLFYSEAMKMHGYPQREEVEVTEDKHQGGQDK